MSLLATGNQTEKKTFKQKMKEFFTIPKGELKYRLLPLILFFALIALDQISKALVVAFIDQGESIPVIGNWFILTHVRNQGIAWSGFQSLTGFGRIFFLILLPLIFLILFSIWTFFTKELSKVQRWASTAIVAGGIGNLIDRVFRYASGPYDFTNGVVDFMDMAFFKIPGISPTGRWPVWNLADSYIVIGVTVLVISMIVIEIKAHKQKKEKK